MLEVAEMDVIIAIITISDATGAIVFTVNNI